MNILNIFRLKRNIYWYLESNEANVYAIMRHKNWFMTVRFNGELMIDSQQKYLDQIIKNLNR